jgi:hypothetical protein
VLAALAAAGCGAASHAAAPRIERTFDVAWHDEATAEHVVYTTNAIRFHDGRWSARISIENRTNGPLYEATWSPPGDYGTTWNGPALAYSGLDVLGNRRLIFVPADREVPDIPYPIPAGATWRGTISGAVPAEPKLPHGSPIWVRYPVLGIGRPWDGFTTTAAVQWISAKAIEL